MTHLSWVLYNRPEHPLIYLINARDLSGAVGNRQGSSEEVIMQVLNYDPDPVFIHIHDGNDIEWRRVANINCIKKWPVFFRSDQKIEKIFKFDCFDIENTHTRNIFAMYRQKIFPYHGFIEKNFLSERLEWYRQWYEIRHAHSPHEVNGSTYIVPGQKKINLYQLHLKDIMGQGLFDVLEQAVTDSECGDFDFQYARGFHDNYVKSQTNLEWFDIIKEFKKQSIHEKIFSSTMYQSLLLEEMIPQLEQSKIDWKNLSTQQCVELYLKQIKDRT
jgi:hypothetical protein